MIAKDNGMRDEYKGDGPVFDSAVLKVLREVLQENLAELLASVPVEADRALNRIKAAVAAEDLNAAREAGQSIRGMALNFGALRLATIARNIAVDSQELEAVSRHVVPLERAIADARAQLATMAYA